MEHYKELWYDYKVLQEAAVDMRGDIGVDSITFKEQEGAHSPTKNRKAAGFGINSELLKHSSKMCIRDSMWDIK